MASTGPVFDRQEQLQKVQGGLLDGERIFAVYDLKGGGVGFIGITSKRLIVFDRTYLIERQAMVSIPYDRIVTVAAEEHPNPIAGRGFFSSSKLMLLLQGEKHYEFEFRGADKALHAHNLILWHMLSPGE
jgi:PH (Pleckstrin Homology) domain-containing protein